MKDSILVIGLIILVAMLLSIPYVLNKQINDANMKCVNSGHQFINEGAGWICR